MLNWEISVCAFETPKFTLAKTGDLRSCAVQWRRRQDFSAGDTLSAEGRRLWNPAFGGDVSRNRGPRVEMRGELSLDGRTRSRESLSFALSGTYPKTFTHGIQPQHHSWFAIFYHEIQKHSQTAQRAVL
jgi:hypothetical protein